MWFLLVSVGRMFAWRSSWKIEPSNCGPGMKRHRLRRCCAIRGNGVWGAVSPKKPWKAPISSEFIQFNEENNGKHEEIIGNDEIFDHFCWRGYLRMNPNKLVEATDTPRPRFFKLLKLSARYTQKDRSGGKVHLSEGQYQDLVQKMKEILLLDSISTRFRLDSSSS